LPPKLSRPAHAFWPLAGEERPPGGESMAAVIARVGATLERLAREQAGRDVVAVTHGGTIRAAVAYALRIGRRQRTAPVRAQPVADPPGSAPGGMARGLRERAPGEEA